MARVILIGPKSSGKTAAFQNILRYSNYMKTHETVGVSSSIVKIKPPLCGFRTFSVTIVDLGGSEKIRDMWTSQFFDTSGAIYFLRHTDGLEYEKTIIDTNPHYVISL